MGILDEVMKYRQYRDSQNNATADAVPGILQNFLAGQQQRKTNLLDQFKVQADLAKSGLGASTDQNGNLSDIYNRPDLGNNLKDLLTQSQIAKNIASTKQLSGINDSGNQEIDTSTPEGKAAFLATLPKAKQTTIQGIVNGDLDVTKMTSLRNNERESLIEAAKKYDPTFSMTNYPVRLKAREQFTSGDYSKALNSANTLVGHLGTLEDVYKQAGLGDIPLLNDAGLKINSAFGGDKKVKIDQAVTAVSNELATVFKNTGATDQEIEHWKTSIANAPSPQQQKAIIDGAVNLLGSRLNALGDTYKNAFGKQYDFSPLSDKSKSYLSTKGFNLGSANNYNFATSADAEKADIPVGTIVTIGNKKFKKTG